MSGLNLQIPINHMGYGIVGYNIWKEIRKRFDTPVFPIGQIDPPSQNVNVEQLQNDINRGFVASSPCLKVWHEHSLAERIGNGIYFAYPFFEINKFDKRRKDHLQSVDYLFVSSEWAKQIIEDQTVLQSSDIIVAPCGVDRNIFNEYGNVPNSQKCIFYNCGKWEIRKGHDILHKAFKDAFPNGNEDVELWMMTKNPFLNIEEEYQWERQYINDHRIRFIPRVRSQEEVADIMKKIFCGVFPARAEGWNLELLELMACGKQVIATNYSAHTEFCTEQNCSLIDIVEEEQAYDGKWFKGDCGTWASLEGEAYDQLVYHLRAKYELWKTNNNILNSEGIKTSLNLSWENTASIMENAINECTR